MENLGENLKKGENAKQTKCAKCEKSYTMFLFSDPKVGMNEENYKCPACGSVEKTSL